jgi:hypothetical protein
MHDKPKLSRGHRQRAAAERRTLESGVLGKRARTVRGRGGQKSVGKTITRWPPTPLFGEFYF